MTAALLILLVVLLVGIGEIVYKNRTRRDASRPWEEL